MFAAQCSVSSSTDQTTNKPKRSTNQLSEFLQTTILLFLPRAFQSDKFIFALSLTILPVLFQQLFLALTIASTLLHGRRRQMDFAEEQMRLTRPPKTLGGVFYFLLLFSLSYNCSSNQQPKKQQQTNHYLNTLYN